MQARIFVQIPAIALVKTGSTQAGWPGFLIDATPLIPLLKTSFNSFWTRNKNRGDRKKLLKAILLSTVTLDVGLHEPCDRLKWVEHVSRLNCEGPNAIYAMYRMHCPSFMKLCDLIDHNVRKSFKMANRRTSHSVGVITTTLFALHCCLHW